MVGIVARKTTIIGESNAMALIAPMEDGMILSEQVVMLEATNEVEENKVAEELIITTGEDVGTSESKDMSKHIVQPNKDMNGMKTSRIQTKMLAPLDTMIGIVVKCQVKNMIVL